MCRRATRSRWRCWLGRHIAVAADRVGAAAVALQVALLAPGGVFEDVRSSRRSIGLTSRGIGVEAKSLALPLRPVLRFAQINATTWREAAKPPVAVVRTWGTRWAAGLRASTEGLCGSTDVFCSCGAFRRPHSGLGAPCHMMWHASYIIVTCLPSGAFSAQLWVSDIVALAELHTIVSKDVVSGCDMEVEIRDYEPQQILHSLPLHLALPEFEGDVLVFSPVDL